MIYTSYFGAVRGLDTERYCIINIALYPPRGYIGESMKELAPTSTMLKKYKDASSYSWQMYEFDFDKYVLSKLKQRTVALGMRKLARNREIVLVCYEKEGNCHRHLVAKWLQAAGIECVELKRKGE